MLLVNQKLVKKKSRRSATSQDSVIDENYNALK
jgi:hypothetical protein